MDDASPPPLHIVIFPWLAFGHMLPNLELAERLATRGHCVSFVSTPPPPPLHIVIFPWLAFGHMLPNLELAERLATRGHCVSFVSTPRNITRLRRTVTPELIDLVALPFQRLDGLPDGTETTSDVPAGKLDLFYKAFDGLAAPFSAFLDAACADDNKPVDLLIVDSFQYWAAAAATDHKVLDLFRVILQYLKKDKAHVAKAY